MLNQLLHLLGAGSIHTSGELAARLGVTESLVGQMLDDLTHMGYLRPVSSLTCHSGSNGSPAAPGNAAHCADCALSGTCGAVGEAGDRMWALTDKALRRQTASS